MKRFLKGFVICIFLTTLLSCCVFFSFNKPKQIKAEVVSGAVIGAGLLAVLGASFFSLYGIDVNFEGMTSGQVNDFFNSYASSYINAQQIDNNMWNTVTGAIESAYYDQVTAMSKGLENTAEWSIAVGNDVADFFKGFAEWFIEDNSLTDDSFVNLYNSDSISIDDLSYPLLTYFSGYEGYSIDNSLGYSVISSDSISYPIGVTSIYIDSSHRIDVTFNEPVDNANGYNQRIYVRYYYNDTLVSSSNKTGIISSPRNNPNIPLNNVFQFSVYNNQLVLVCLARSYLTSHNFNYVYLTPSGGSASAFDISNFETSSISVEGALNEGYQDYQDAINGVLDDAGTYEDGVVVTGVGTYEGVLTGEDLIENVLAGVAVNEYTATLEGAYENQEEAEKDHEGTGSTSINVPSGWVTISGLQDFFPWCIPFDLYNVISIFNASPTAPQFTWKMDFAGRFAPYDINIDLSDWNVVAQIFRAMVVIVFLIFLIIKTRDLIKG